jgi:TonB family protein
MMARKSFWLFVFALPVTLSAAHGADASCQPQTPPRLIRGDHMNVPYPALSKILREHGTTQLEITLDPSGRPLAVSVAKSSGSLRLDDAAMDYVKRYWHWQMPATGCKPTTIKLNMAWDLKMIGATTIPGAVLYPAVTDYPPEALARHEAGLVLIGMTIPANGGAPRNLAVDHSSGFSDLDAKAEDVIKQHTWAPAQMDGKAVNTFTVIMVVWKLPAAGK